MHKIFLLEQGGTGSHSHGQNWRKWKWHLALVCQQPFSQPDFFSFRSPASKFSQPLWFWPPVLSWIHLQGRTRGPAQPVRSAHLDTDISREWLSRQGRCTFCALRWNCLQLRPTQWEEKPGDVDSAEGVFSDQRTLFAYTTLTRVPATSNRSANPEH